METNIKVRLYASWGVLSLVKEIAQQSKPDSEIIAEIRDILKDIEDK